MGVLGADVLGGTHHIRLGLLDKDTLMRSRNALMGSFPLLIGLMSCDDIPAHDDPRDSLDPEADGRCTGLATQCDDRPASRCGGTCRVTTGCVTDALAVCTAITVANTCDTNTACRWRDGRCETQVNTCYINESEVACRQSPSNCSWGNACTGEFISCFLLEVRSSCVASGCVWEPE